MRDLPMPNKKCKQQSAQEPSSTVTPGSLVFYVDENSTQVMGPISHVGIAIEHESRLMLVHAVPDKGVITRYFSPTNHNYFCISPWPETSKETQKVIDMNMNFANIEEAKEKEKKSNTQKKQSKGSKKKSTRRPSTHIHIEYSKARAKYLQDAQQEASEASKDKKTAKMYAHHLIRKSRKSYFCKRNPHLAAYHTIAAKISNLINHKNKKTKLSLERTRRSTGEKKVFTSGWHCSQFALMMFQMAYKYTPKGYKLASEKYASRKKSTESEYSDPTQYQYLTGRDISDSSLPEFLTKDAKTMSPAAIMTCLLNDDPNGDGGAPMDREYSFSDDISDKFKTLIINTKSALSIHKASAETLLSPSHVNQLKINLLEIQCMLFGIHKLIHPQVRLNKIFTSHELPDLRIKVERPLSRRREREEREERPVKRARITTRRAR
jgi:hypothetical protein